MLDARMTKLASERFKDPDIAARQLLGAAVMNDNKGVKIERPDGSMETYVVKRVTWD